MRHVQECTFVGQDLYPQSLRRSNFLRNAISAGRRRGLILNRPYMAKTRALLILILRAATAYGGTVTGNLLGPSGLPIKNGTLNFNLQQAGLMVGTGSVVPTAAQGFTSTDGSVVGMPNPLSAPAPAISYGSGSVPAGIYYLEYAWYGQGGAVTLPSPELA